MFVGGYRKKTPHVSTVLNKCNIFSAYTQDITYVFCFVTSPTRTTGTVLTSAKARLTGVAIRIRIRIQIPDLDCHQNLIISSLAHCQPTLKI